MTARVLVIGAGGLGCGALIALSRCGIAEITLTIVDPDRVEASNLHRQVIYGEHDAGAPKAERAAVWCASRGLRARALVARVDAENVLGLAREHDVVIEGTDRIETKFLVADACAIAGVAVVHAGVVRWDGWAMATLPRSSAPDEEASACLRCVFEDPPPPGATVATCSEAGVIGPAVGALGALEAALAARVLAGDRSAGGVILRYDALAGSARSSRVRRRASCAVCGERPTIRALDASRYAPACPA